MNRLWRGEEEIPESFKVGVICPIHKGGNRGDAEYNREISVMTVNTGCKIGMMMVKNSMVEEAAEKQLTTGRKEGV